MPESLENQSKYSSFFVNNSKQESTSVKLEKVPSKTINTVSLCIPKLIIPKLARQTNI